MPELAKRVSFAIVAAPAFLGVLWLGGEFFHFLVILIGILIHREFTGIINSDGSKASYIPGLLIMLWVISYPLKFYFLETGLLLFATYLALETMRSEANYLERISSTIISGLYPGIAMMSLYLIRDIQFFYLVPVDGFAVAMMFVLMIWGNDVFAYFGGKSFGKHPLAPSISPKKTWEGFFSGFIGGFVALGITYYFFSDVMPDIWVAIPAVLITGVFGPLGDLAQSKMKRSARIKDSANIIPGHGGFFDRFDAMMLAAPVYLVYASLMF